MRYEQRYLECLEWRRPELERLLRRIGFSVQVARDATEEAIREAVKLIGYHAVETLRDRWAWLRKVAICKARSICGSRWYSILQLDTQIVTVQSSREDDETEADCYAAVRAAFDHLAPDRRELFAYVYLDGHTYSEAVERFNLCLGVISRRLAEAREQLRSELIQLPEFRARADASI